MDLKDQVRLKNSFDTFFDKKLKRIIEDNRRRYRMQLKDEADRKKRKLSCLSSTKSTAAVDRYVERCLQELHMDPDALSYTARMLGGPEVDQQARWLTELFRYRAENTFPFFTWNESSLTAGGTDGLECAFVSWKRETYRRDDKPFYFATDALGNRMEVSAEDYEMGSTMYPDSYGMEERQRVVVARDTWWIDQLMPKRDCWWDPKAPLLNVNLGQFAGVKLPQTADEVQSYIESGMYDAFDPEGNEDLAEALKGFQRVSRQDTASQTADRAGTIGTTDDVDLGDRNLIEVWCSFWKLMGQWVCQYSIEGTKELSTVRPVNEVFFAGRDWPFLPLIVGTHKLKLWENVGRGQPETIAPLEDEWIDHRNNINDAAKQQIQGRWRVTPGSDVILDDLLNGKIIYADEGEFTRLEDKAVGLMESLRAADSINADMNEILPAAIESSARGIVPKGTEKGLGMTQLTLASSDGKLAVQIMTRNQTFLKPVMATIAELTFAYESDSVIARIAGQKAGYAVPTQTTWDGQMLVDFRALDFPVNVQINAGMGAIPRQQKASSIDQINTWGKANNIPMKTNEMFGQLCVLSGWGKDQFIDTTPQQPPPPPMEFKITVDWKDLPQDFQVAALSVLASGQAKGTTISVTDNAEGELERKMNLARQNGGGMMQPERSTLPVTDMMGEEGMKMAEGGMR